MNASCRLAVLCLLSLLLGASISRSAPATTRADVEAIAKTIETRFYDVARGRKIADDLRSATARGDFDAYSDNRELAAALTDRLKPLDRHFNVQWTAPATSDASSVSTARAPAGKGRPHHGIRRVEVLPGNVGYLDLRQFMGFEFGKPDQRARLAIDAALQLLADTDAVIIDLRGNGGGSPAMVGYLTSAFTPKGADIYNTFHWREGTESEAPRDWYPTPRLQVPLYVLISARTGSAAEAFAYTLKNAKRATLVGEVSGGAANPGDEVATGNGFTLFVSGGSPISPITGTNWEGTGVIPDVAVASAMALETARVLALQAALERLPATEATEPRWALDALRAETSQRRDLVVSDYVGEFGAMSVKLEQGQLWMQRGRRPPVALLPLEADVFTVAADPDQRIHFMRDTGRAVIAMEIEALGGRSSRYRRSQ